MIARIHRKLGTAGFVISIVTLVAALGGGAYAASGGLTGKQKKEVEKIAKKYAGKPGKKGKNGAPGATGAAGPQGPAGAKGDNGSSGANGTNGASGEPGVPGVKGDRGERGLPGNPGQSPIVVPLQSGESGSPCPQGGAKIVGVNGEEASACNGEEGSGGGGGYPETLPTGHSMTGLWNVQGEASEFLFGTMETALATVSFPLPLATPTTETVLIGTSPTQEEEEKCPGTGAEPKAIPGILCLYILGESSGSPTPGLLLSGGESYGALLAFEKGDKAYGSWAVKAG